MEERRLYLAPMAGITDTAMRELCIEQGAQMTYTEMVSAKGLLYNNIKTQDLLALGPLETQAGVQLFGSDPALLAEMANRLQGVLGARLAEVNINMGCPAPKIVNNGDGCALMKELPLAARIIAAVKKAVAVPVSVKFRKGWDDGCVNAVAFAKMAEDSGADVVIVHGRTREQFYSGKADWETIRQVREAVHIQVVGNGDIFTAADALQMMEQTGCNKVMVGRGAQGNPFLFHQITAALAGKTVELPTEAQRIEMCLRQARRAIGYKGERLAMLQMRTHAPHYTKGMRNSAPLRAALVQVQSYAQLEELLQGYLQNND